MNAQLQLMIDYTTAVLNGIAVFLGTPPVFYAFCLVLFALLCQAIRYIMWGRR